jgi:hypothetical protein
VRAIPEQLAVTHSLFINISVIRDIVHYQRVSASVTGGLLALLAENRLSRGMVALALDTHLRRA